MENENKPKFKNIFYIINTLILLIILFSMLYFFRNLDNRTKKLEESTLPYFQNLNGAISNQNSNLNINENINKEIVFERPEEIPNYISGIIFTVDGNELTIKQDSNDDFKYKIVKDDIKKITQEKINSIYKNDNIDNLKKKAETNPDLLKNSPLITETNIPWNELAPNMMINLKSVGNGKKEITVHTKEIEDFFQNDQLNQLPPQL